MFLHWRGAAWASEVSPEWLKWTLKRFFQDTKDGPKGAVLYTDPKPRRDKTLGWSVRPPKWLVRMGEEGQ